MDPLKDLDDFLRAHGVRSFQAKELVHLGKRAKNGAVVEMPPRSMWWHIIPTVQILERVRRVVGPIVILSGYRNEAYNRAVGGESASLHMHFNALDWRPTDFDKFDPKDLARFAESYGYGPNYVSIGQYDDASPEDGVKTGFCHIDTRTVVFGHKAARWLGKV